MRTVKAQEHSAKRDKILDTALELIYRKGYKATSIEDIIVALDISKGAFYHYFSSKQALLDALVERMKQAATEKLEAIADDMNLSATEKFNRYFEMSIKWKAENKPLTSSAMRLWYADQNALFRQKLSSEALDYTSRLFESFIRQGLEEAAFATPYPRQCALIIAGMSLNLSDEFARLMLSNEPMKETEAAMRDVLGAYTDSIERILGAAPHSLQALDEKTLRITLRGLIRS